MAEMGRDTYRSADDPERRRWQNPDKILPSIGLTQGLTFVDIGCGSGFFALPAARIVGLNGTVYGLDKNPEYIARIRVQAKSEGLRNLHLTVGNAEKLVLCEGCADIVFFGIVLHDFNNPAEVLNNARRMIKPTGKLVDLDWRKEPMPIGPPLEIRFDTKTATQLIETAGFTTQTVAECGSYHYLIIARP